MSNFKKLRHIRSYNGKYPKIAKNVYIDELSTVVGDIEIEEGVNIWPSVAIRADVNHMYIGRNTNIQDGTVLHVTAPSKDYPNGFDLSIGENVTIGHHVMLHGCHIGSRVLIGMSSTVLDGAVVEDDVILAAGSVVPPGKVLKSGYMYMGIPAQPKREITDKDKADILQNAHHYVEVMQSYIQEREEYDNLLENGRKEYVELETQVYESVLKQRSLEKKLEVLESKVTKLTKKSVNKAAKPKKSSKFKSKKIKPKNKKKKS